MIKGALRGSALATAGLLLAPSGSMAQTVQYGPELASVQFQDGPIAQYPYYNLPPSNFGLDYLAVSHITFEGGLNALRSDTRFRTRLSPAQNRILDAVSIEVLNVDHVVMASSLRDTGSVIKVSRGSAFFVDYFIITMGLLEQLDDDLMIALALESEQGVNYARRRWFNPQTYFAMRGKLLQPPSPTGWGSTYLNGNLLVQTALTHELCHLFLGHKPLEAPSLEVLRQREIDADRCTIDHLLALNANPEMGLTFALAVAVIGDPASSSHPPSPERWAAARAAGEEFIAEAMARGFMTPIDAAKYRTGITRLQNAIQFAAKRAHDAAMAEAAARAAAEAAEAEEEAAEEAAAEGADMGDETDADSE